MVARIPNRIEPLRLVERNASLAGELPVREFPRLAELLADALGTITIELQFGRSETGVPHVLGRIAATLSLECQRCMQPMSWPIDVVVRWELVDSIDNPGRLGGEFDTVAMGDSPIELPALIEDELILAVPYAPSHDETACKLLDGINQDSTRANISPFAVLTQLKFKKTNS
jgi:uncharacterized protein